MPGSLSDVPMPACIIHYTLAKQMGTSVKMIEVHYGHLQPSQKATFSSP